MSGILDPRIPTYRNSDQAKYKMDKQGKQMSSSSKAFFVSFFDVIFLKG